MTEPATVCPTCLRTLDDEAARELDDALNRGATLQELVDRLAKKAAAARYPTPSDGYLS